MPRRERGNIVELPFLLLLVALFIIGVSVLFPRIGWLAFPAALVAPIALFLIVRALLNIRP
jgi:hypothetical protein